MRTRNLKKTIAVLSLSMVVMTSSIVAKEHSNNDNNTIIPYKFYNSIFPVIGSNPTYGKFYGAAVSSGVTLGDPSTTKMSTVSASAAWTSKNQTMYLIKSIGYTENNDWMFIEDSRVFLSSQDTYGLGTGRTVDGRSQNSLTSDDAQPMDFDLLRFYLTIAKKIKPSLYFGIGYMVDKYKNVKDLNYNADTKTSYHTYSTKHGFDLKSTTLSGVSLNLIYDTRDNIATPYSGMYAFASYKYFPKFLGSDKKSSSLWLEFRDYFSLDKQNPRKLLALWSYVNTVTSGKMPYLDLPALGWDQFGRSGRGYIQGRFRGEDIFYTELELRMPLPISKKHPNRYGYTLFVNTTSASDKDRNQKFLQNFQFGAGVGFRFLLNKKSRAYLTADLAIDENKKRNFYLNINESF